MIRQRFFLLFLLLALVLAGCAANGPDTAGETAAPEPVSSSAAEEETAIRSLCLGRWQRSTGTEGPESFVLLADGSCTLDGRSCTWVLEPGRYPAIRILDGRRELWCLYGHFLGNGHREFGMLYRGAQNTLYFNPDRYRAVALTPDNWLEYFEMRETYSFGHDGAGQPVNFRFSREVRLREEYASLLSHMAASTLTLKYTARVGLATVVFGPETEAFTITPNKEAPPSGPYIWNAVSENGSFCRNIDGFSLGTLETAQVRLEEDYQFLHVGGILYLNDNDNRESG